MNFFVLDNLPDIREVVFNFISKTGYRAKKKPQMKDMWLVRFILHFELLKTLSDIPIEYAPSSVFPFCIDNVTSTELYSYYVCKTVRQTLPHFRWNVDKV